MRVLLRSFSDRHPPRKDLLQNGEPSKGWHARACQGSCRERVSPSGEHVSPSPPPSISSFSFISENPQRASPCSSYYSSWTIPKSFIMPMTPIVIGRTPWSLPPQRLAPSPASPLRIPRGGAAGSKSASDDDDDDDDENVDNPIVHEILQAGDDYYRVLALDGPARDTLTPSQIQKAYRRRAVQTHPDKTGGDRRAFDLVAKAFEVLGNPDTRAIYDRFGVAGLVQGAHSSASSFSDVLHNFFHMQHPQQFTRQQANRTVRYQLQVTLEDLYQGISRAIWVSAPGHSRKGKTVHVQVPRGSVAGQPIVLSGEMDLQDNQTPGDIIFVLATRPHPVFTRKNHDLAMELTISLEEALCGFQRKIQHLDKTWLEIQSASLPGHEHHHHHDGNSSEESASSPMIIATGDVQVLKGHGFPKSALGDEYGDLYIQFRVEMPKSAKNPLSPDERQELLRLLEKLQGKRNTTSKSKRKKTRSKSLTAEETAIKDDSTDNAATTIHRLVPGKVSDFGRATGTAHWHADDDDPHHHHEYPGAGFHSFFQSGQGTKSFYFGNHPFFGEDGEPGLDEAPHSQCQQM